VRRVERLVREGADELVSAHPDVAMHPPHRKMDPVLTKGLIPTQGVLVVRVDERAVDVEDGSGRHGSPLPKSACL
jgi:hypothetical protein